MEGAAGILRRFVVATIIISVLVLAVNYMILGVWVFKGMGEGKSPASVSQSVAEGLRLQDERYELNENSTKLLRENHAWAMLINQNGDVVWHKATPDDLPDHYSLTDVAKFSRHYLMDYPVFVWEHEHGLVVVGYPKDSVAKYPFVFPVSWVSDLPSRFVELLIGNIALALLLSLFIGFMLIRSIRPLVEGIYAIAKEQRVYVQPKGVLSDLAKSINHTSLLLEEKNASLKARDEARANWIAGISHDVRTPLSMVLGHASDLEENDKIPAEQREQAQNYTPARRKAQVSGQ